MDPIDREKPWTPLGQLVLLTLVIGVVYLIFRFAVVIPDWGWQIIGVSTAVGVVLYYQLAFRRDPKKKTGEQSGPGKPKLEPLRAALALVLILALTAPIWIVLYFVWKGGELWR